MDWKQHQSIRFWNCHRGRSERWTWAIPTSKQNSDFGLQTKAIYQYRFQTFRLKLYSEFFSRTYRIHKITRQGRRQSRVVHYWPKGWRSFDSRNVLPTTWYRVNCDSRSQKHFQRSMLWPKRTTSCLCRTYGSWRPCSWFGKEKWKNIF